MTKLTFEPEDFKPGESITVLFNNNWLGDLICLEDGSYYFDPVDKGGVWSGWILRQIADKLEEVNKPWEDLIAKTFH